ncbi:hypothetical protein EMCRGX_G001968 [Ephydatia muelleri]
MACWPSRRSGHVDHRDPKKPLNSDKITIAVPIHSSTVFLTQTCLFPSKSVSGNINSSAFTEGLADVLIKNSKLCKSVEVEFCGQQMQKPVIVAEIYAKINMTLVHSSIVRAILARELLAPLIAFAVVLFLVLIML